jgi:hypothetical protein
MVYNLVIPCSGPGSRSASYSKFHKTLLRVGSNAVIDNIIAAFPYAQTVYIMLGHNHEYIRQYIEHAGYTNVEFIWIDNWEESQIASLKQIPKHVFETPFYLNSCDNWSPEVPTATENTVYLCHPDNVDYYDRVNGKGIFAGIGFIKDTLEFYNALHSTNAVRNDYLVYNQLQTLNHVMLDNWYDVGNSESYNLTKLSFPDKFDLLDKHHQEIYYINNRIVKLFDKPIHRLKDILSGSNAFPHPQPIHFTDFGLSYEFVNGVTNAIGNNYSVVFQNLENLWTYCINNNAVINSKEIWRDKTVERFDRMISKYPEFSKQISINGITIDPIRLIENLDWQTINTGISGPCHGDLILENIIVTDTGIRYIDHREGIVTDIFYDICKFYHNLQLNNINMKHFKLENVKSDYSINIDYMFLDRLEKFKQSNIYKNNRKKIELSVGCIWLSMAPLNVDDNLNRFLFLHSIRQLYNASKL